MPRFAILEHDFPTLHWDLLLEDGPACRTWRLSTPPDVSSDFPSPLEGEGGRRPDEGVVSDIACQETHFLHSQSLVDHPLTLSPTGARGPNQNASRIDTNAPGERGEKKSPRLLYAELLPDHRLMYLDYEGPVSGNRGYVKKWDVGAFAWITARDDCVSVVLQGERWTGQIDLTRQPDAWRVKFTPATMQQAGKPRPAV